MTKSVEISDSTYDRLQALAEPFTDTPDSVIVRLLSFYEQHKAEPGSGPIEPTSLPIPESQLIALPSALQRDLRFIKPEVLSIEGESMLVRDWADLCEKFVCWLVRNDYLRSQKLPIYNHGGRDKYFINTKPEHLDSRKDGNWRKVEGFYVDIKYNAKQHMQNLISTLEQLRLETLKIKIGIPGHAHR